MVQMLLASTSKKPTPHSIFTSFNLSIVEPAPASISPFLGAVLAGRNQASRPRSAPGRDPRLAIQHLRDPKPRSLCGLGRQRPRIVEAAFDDLAIRFGQAVLVELPDDIDRDVV